MRIQHVHVMTDVGDFAIFAAEMGGTEDVLKAVRQKLRELDAYHREDNPEMYT